MCQDRGVENGSSVFGGGLHRWSGRWVRYSTTHGWMPLPAAQVEPVARRGPQVDVDQAVDQRGRHRPGQRLVGGAVAGADHDRAGRQLVRADAAVEDERVERLLDVGRGGVQLVEEQAVRLVAGDLLRRAEPAAAVDDLRHADQVLRRELGAEQRHAVEPERRGEIPYQGGLPDAGRAPEEHRPDDGGVQQDFGQLGGRDRELGVQAWTS